MTEPLPCGRCGRPLPSNSRWGYCPACLLEPEPSTDDSGSRSGADPSSTRLFGNYELGAQIGRGGMGVVYEAMHRDLRRRVAIKMIVDVHETSSSARRRFAIEAEAAAKLDHPNIVAIYDVGEVDDRPYLSMQLIQGESLARLIRRRKYGLVRGDGQGGERFVGSEETTVAALMVKLARAVHHAHQHGVLHRDLKPANILIDQSGEPHLTDFGLAKILEPNFREAQGSTPFSTTGLLGTPNYMSPEQAAHGQLTEATDVYGLGTVLYELLTGRPPFSGSTLLEIARKVENEEPVSPTRRFPQLDAGLATICLKCLEKDPKRRYGSVAALMSDLECWLRDEPIQAYPINRWQRIARWVKRNPMGAGLIASLGMCLFALVLLLQMAHRRADADANGRAWALERLQSAIQALWRDESQESVHIHSNDLAALNNQEIRPPATNALHLSFGLTIGADPINLAQAYAPLLGALEKSMQRRLNCQVFLHLDLHKRHSWAVLQGGRGQAEIQRIAPLTYVQLKRTTPVHLLCQERNGHEGVIFARADSGFRSLQDAAFSVAAFGHTNSVVSFLAKVHMARAGLCVTNLSVTNLGIPSISGTANTDDEQEQEVFAHREVIERVRRLGADVGVAPAGRFRTVAMRSPRLHELHRFQVTPHVYIARADVKPAVVEALRQCLLEVDARELLSPLGACMGSGFKAVTDSNLDEVRRMMAFELHFFETGQSAP